MTYDEYKELLFKLKTSDSVTQRYDIGRIIFEEAQKLLCRLNNLHEKYLGGPYYGSKDYDIISILWDRCNSVICVLEEKTYKCNNSIHVTLIELPMKYLCEREFEILRKTFISRRLSILMDRIRNEKENIRHYSELMKTDNAILEVLREELNK